MTVYTDNQVEQLFGAWLEANPALLAPTGIAFTDASITSATGSSQTVAAASATRKALIIANPATTTWWINPSGGTAAANGAGCFELAPGKVWTPRVAPTNAVTGIGTSTSKLTVTAG